jgi:hypothetical protein
MNSIWHTNNTTRTQGIGLRGGACVPVMLAPLSIEIQKDFVDHDPGGSDG